MFNYLLIDKDYAAELLESYKKANNFPLNNNADNGDAVIDTLQNENDLNVGNVLSCVGPAKKKKNTKAAQTSKLFHESFEF